MWCCCSWTAAHHPGHGDAYIVQLLRHCAAPLVVGLNKQDLVSPKRAVELQRSYRSLVGGCPFFGFSALRGVGCEQLVEGLSQRLPEGPHLYPPHAVSDQPERLLLAEQIREQVLHLTREEVPPQCGCAYWTISGKSVTAPASPPWRLWSGVARRGSSLGKEAPC